MDTNKRIYPLVKDITFRAKRKDTGEEIEGSSIIGLTSALTGRKKFFMLQRSETLHEPFLLDIDGNGYQLTGRMYQIDLSTLTMDIETESVDEV